MKLFTFTVLAMFSLANGQTTTIIRPAPLIEEVNEIVTEILNSAQLPSTGPPTLAYMLPKLYEMNGIVLKDAFNYTLASFVSTVQQLGTSDAPTRALIASKKQNACFKNLLSFLDSFIEMSGYSVASCFQLYNPSVLNSTDLYYQDLAAMGTAVNDIQAMLLSPFIGRNPFTQPDEIIADYKAQQSATLDGRAADLARLMEEINEFTLGWQSESISIVTCLGTIFDDVSANYAMVQVQIPKCTAFKGP